MNHTTSVCPSAAELRGLIHGTLPAGRQEELSEHLSECADCQKAIEEAAASGWRWQQAASRIDLATPPPADSAYWKALQSAEAAARRANQIEETSVNPEPAATEDEPFEFLQPSDVPGHLGKLGDYFEVVKLIGRGGMGVVLDVLDGCLHRHVAVKVLAPKLARDKNARDRFLREARAAALIDHPNVVGIHYIDHAKTPAGDEVIYLVMPLIEGESLQDRLDRSGGPLPIESVVRIGAQVADGLAAAHARGLVHRDVKPANILLEGDSDRVRITDFGLARAALDMKLTQTGFVAGTPLYMAPEQARGEEVDHRADLFSLGSVLYAMVTGHAPFPGSTPFVVLRGVTEETPKPVREFNDRVPDWLVGLIAKLHAKAPADRFQTAAEVAELLHSQMAECPNMVKSSAAQKVAALAAPPRRHSAFLGWGTALVFAGLWLAEVAGVTQFRPDAPAAPVAAADPQTPAPRSPLPALTLKGEAGPVWGVAYSRDGKSLAMAVDDGTIKVWDAATGKLRRSLGRHDGTVWAVAFDPTDANAVASASDDGAVKVWDVSTGKSREWRASGAVRTLAFSPDGKRVVTGCRDGSVTVWDAPTGSRLVGTAGHRHIVMAVAFTPDGEAVVSAAGDKKILVWDAVTGQPRGEIDAPKAGVYALALSPDGKRVAYGGWNRDGKALHVWDNDKGQTGWEGDGHGSDVWGVAFSPDGSLLASASEDRTVKVWDVATGAEKASFAGHAGVVYGVAFAPDGRSVASASRDGTVRVWEVK